LDTGSYWGLLGIVALVAANGFFVAGEFALVKVRKTRIDQLVDEGHRVARVAQGEIAHLDSYIAATQLGITLASLALGWIGEPALAAVIDPPLQLVTGGVSHELADGIALAVSFTLITLFHIVLGELVPKSIALQRTEGTALFVARPLYVFAHLFGPIVSLMNGIGNAVVRLLGLAAGGAHVSVHSVEELEMLVTQSREAGVLDPGEEVLLRRVFDFAGTTAQQVMTPRTEIVAAPRTVTAAALAELVRVERYTRIPVYEGDLDNIVGLIHVKDLVPRLLGPAHAAPFAVEEILRPVLRAPETAHIESLMAQMQARKAHMTVVIDEYGGTAGIVTLEDIIEEVFGPVRDEFDTRESDTLPEVQALPGGGASVDGLMRVGDFADRFGLDLRDRAYEPVGGLVFGRLGRAPALGDSVPLGAYRLQVEALDHLRIARLRVLPADPPPPADVPSERAKGDSP
jgi:putative hemolysin